MLHVKLSEWGKTRHKKTFCALCANSSHTNCVFLHIGVEIWKKKKAWCSTSSLLVTFIQTAWECDTEPESWYPWCQPVNLRPLSEETQLAFAVFTSLTVQSGQIIWYSLSFSSLVLNYTAPTLGSRNFPSNLKQLLLKLLQQWAHGHGLV